VTDGDYDLVIDNHYGPASAIKKERGIKISYTAEATLPNIDDYDLLIGFDYVDSPKYMRLPYYYLSWGKKIKPGLKMRAENGVCNPNKKYFACFLVSNNMKNSYYTKLPMDGIIARNRIFHKLSLYKDVASGGKHLNNINEIIPRERAKVLNWLSQCKFVIAYENQTYKGYITEKPFQAYFAGSIPIYYGDQKALEDINKQALIYAGDFQDEDALVEYVKKIDNDDKLYCDIWNQNLITNQNTDWELQIAELRKRIYDLLERKLKK
jgi:hypothetical protein